MKKIHFTINTCFRYKDIIRLLHQIKSQSGSYKTVVNLFNDGTPDWMSKHIHRCIDELQSEQFVINYAEFPEPHTKYRYWQLVNDNFEAISNDLDFDYYFMLPDDAVLCDDFIDKAISKYESIDDDKLICLNTFTDTLRKGRKSWASIDHNPVQKGDVWHTGWVDMEFICKREFFEVLEYKIKEITVARWQRNPKLGSGVGEQISKRIERSGYHIYQVDDSLTFQHEHHSVMNGDRDFTIMPSRNMRNEREEITVHISTMLSRKESLDETVASLLSNSVVPNKIHIYLNDYTSVSDLIKEELKNGRVILYFAPKGDLKDTGRLYTAEGERGYVFFCDDDLIYPKDYIETMINHIEFNQRKSIITAHGVRLKFPVQNYYDDRIAFKCLHYVPKSQWVHIGGTGAMAYHSNTFSIDISNIRLIVGTDYFSDLWIAIQAQISSVPILCIGHQAKWILSTNSSQIDISDSISSRFREDNDQGSIINKINWKINQPDYFKDFESKLKPVASCHR